MDWLASALGLFGTYRLATHKRDGWILLAVSSALMVFLSMEAEYWGMAVGQFIYVLVEIFGYSRGKQ
jgi:hypothetical protein